MDTADMSGGTGGGPECPEQWKRERMLWFVHEWIQENQTDESFVPELSVARAGQTRPARTLHRHGARRLGRAG
jgi:hypothetical protein